MRTKAIQIAAADSEAPVDHLQEFISLAKSLTGTLIADEDWNLEIWPVGHVFALKGRNLFSRELEFHRLSPRVDLSGASIPSRFPQEFGDFSKAYVRYHHATDPVGYGPTTYRLGAMRFIDAAFEAFGMESDISNLGVVVLNKAVEIASVGASHPERYKRATAIRAVYRFCSRRNFLDVPFQWNHTVRRPSDKVELINDEGKAWRESRLPSPRAFYALAEVYRNGTDFRDRLLSAVIAICVSIPIRAHEVLRLRDDCEVSTQVKEPMTGEMREAYGIRVWPGKGNPPQIKWVPSAMVSLVREAVARLRELCQPGREVAKWYEQHPFRIYLPKSLRHLRRAQWISTSELTDLFGFGEQESTLTFVRLRSDIRRVEIQTTGKPKFVFNFADVQRYVLSLLPKGFPFFNNDKSQKYSHTLMAVTGYSGQRLSAYFPCMVTQCTSDMFQNWLAREGCSVFERWNAREEDGSFIRVRTHAFRHWLNTVGQLSGLSDIDIAKWSGRDVRDNKHYNHVTSKETVSQVRKALVDGKSPGFLDEPASLMRIKTPVDRAAFTSAQIGSAHITDHGICIHNYSMLPCQNHGDCLKCSENVFIKGNELHLARLRRLLPFLERQLEQAQSAFEESFHGADRWCRSHRASIVRVQRMIACHENDGIADGTLVRLDGSPDTEVAMAIRDRATPHVPVKRTASDNQQDFDEFMQAMWDT